MKATAQFRLRVYRNENVAVGPGKIALLEAVAETGSISAAARRLGMSYRRAWVLMDEVNQAFAAPVVQTATGGARGGGSVLTPTGAALVRHYRAAEADAGRVAAKSIAAIQKLLAG